WLSSLFTQRAAELGLMGQSGCQCVQRKARAAANQGAVDADELQIAADLEFDLARHLGRVPALDDGRDKRGKLVAVARHPAFKRFEQPGVQFALQDRLLK